MNRRYLKVVISNNPDLLIALGDKILQKHYQDGPDSVIPATLSEQIQIKLDVARAMHERRHELERQKEKCNEERRQLLGLSDVKNSYSDNTVRYFVIAARDILLGQYRGNARTLGDWGFTVNSPKGVARVLIPNKADPMIKLAKAIMQKHYSDGESSPLKALDWEQFSTILSEAEQKLEEGRRLDREKEIATQARNIALGLDKGQNSQTPKNLKYLIKSVRDVLLGIYRGRERELGNWGFEVHDGTGSPNSKTDPPAPEE